MSGIAKPAWPIFNRSHPLAVGLCGYWGLTEGSGDLAWDLSGNDNHGTLTAMVSATDWVASPSGHALEFDGNNQFINCGSSSTLNPTSGLTLMAMAFTTASATFKSCVSRWDSGGGVDQRTYLLEITNANKMGFTISRTGTDATKVTLTDPTTLTVGRWYVYVGTWDGANMRLYRNGSLVAGPTAQTAMRVSPTCRTAIGAVAGRTGDLIVSDFVGQIAAAGIWSRALSADEVAELSADPWAFARPMASILRVTMSTRFRRYNPRLALNGLNPGVM